MALTNLRMRLSGAILPLAVAVAGMLPMLLRGASCGHDFDFHLQSWIAVHDAWRAGVFAPDWVPGANYGAGEPRLLFYPALSWVLGALLSFVLPWVLVPAVFCGVCFAGAFLAMRWCVTRVCGADAWAANAAAALYALSPYFLFNAYERSALSELLAAVWLPLLFAELLRSRIRVTPVALAVALLWYTNAPAGVMGMYLAGAVLMLRFVLSFYGRASASQTGELLRGLGGLALGVVLAGDYLLPAWFEQRTVAIDRAVGPGMRVQDSFLFGHTGEAFHDQVLRSVSLLFVVTVAVAGLALAVKLSRQARGKGHRAACEAIVGPVAGIVCVVGLAMQLPWSEPLWTHLPEMGFLQFPWRLLLPVTFAATCLIALAFSKLGKVAGVMLVAGVMVLAPLWANSVCYQPCDGEDNVRAQLELGASGFEGTDEYATTGTDNGEVQQGLPVVRLLKTADADEGDDSATPNPDWKASPGSEVPGVVRVLAWSPRVRQVQIMPQAPAFAVLRMERSDIWEVRVDGEPCVARCVARDDGLVTVQVPAGRASVVSLQAHTPASAWWGRGLSLLGLAGLLTMRRREAVTARLS